jgi:hypothetical protein
MHCQQWESALQWLAFADDKRLETLALVDHARLLAMRVVAQHNRGWNTDEQTHAIQACKKAIALLRGTNMQSSVGIHAAIWLARACVACGMNHEAMEIIETSGWGDLPPNIKAMMNEIRRSAK